MRKLKIHHVRKALIPSAGFATRLFPATRSVPKALMPVMDPKGTLVPAIHRLIDEAVEAGVERVGLVVSPENKPVFERYFFEHLPYGLEKERFGQPDIARHWQRMQHICGRVELITQPSPEGFGDAVLRSRSWIGGEPFLLLLSDYLFRSATQHSCMTQLIQSAVNKRGNLIGLCRMPISEAPKRGAAAGKRHPSLPKRFHLTRIIEKPSILSANKELKSDNLPEGWFFAFFGCYILTPEIFDILEKNALDGLKFRGEYQLTEALEELREIYGCDGLELEGTSLDIGNPQDYLNAFPFLAEQLSSALD